MKKIIIYERQTALPYFPSFRLPEVTSVHIAWDNVDCTVVVLENVAETYGEKQAQVERYSNQKHALVYVIKHYPQEAEDFLGTLPTISLSILILSRLCGVVGSNPAKEMDL
jgi:hypothetical protein